MINPDIIFHNDNTFTSIAPRAVKSPSPLSLCSNFEIPSPSANLFVNRNKIRNKTAKWRNLENSRTFDFDGKI